MIKPLIACITANVPSCAVRPDRHTAVATSLPRYVPTLVGCNREKAVLPLQPPSGHPSPPIIFPCSSPLPKGLRVFEQGKVIANLKSRQAPGPPTVPGSLPAV